MPTVPPIDNSSDDELPGLDVEYEDSDAAVPDESGPGAESPWTHEELDDWYDDTPDAHRFEGSEDLSDALGRAYEAMDLSAGGMFTSREWRRNTLEIKTEYRRQYEAKTAERRAEALRRASRKRLTNFIVTTGGILIVLAFLFWLFNRPGTADQDAGPSTAASVSGDDQPSDTGTENDPAPTPPASEPGGVTELNRVPCRSDTDGCDDKGDVEIVGRPTLESAEGADISFFSSGYDLNANEHQFQVSTSGIGQAVAEAPTTASYQVTIDATTDAGASFTLTMTWTNGSGPVAVVTHDGGDVSNPEVNAFWNTESNLFVGVAVPGIEGLVTTMAVTLTATVPNADGTPGATMSDST